MDAQNQCGIWKVVIVMGVLVALGGIAFFLLQGKPPRPAPLPTSDDMGEARHADRRPARVAIEFTVGPSAHEATVATDEGANLHIGKIVQAVERVAGPNGVMVGAVHRPTGRWVCVLVEGPARYCELDVGLALDDSPGMAASGFIIPPGVVSRTMSAYRSVARSAMDYEWDRGDRIIVLTCPRDQWPDLVLFWPPVPHEDR